MGLDPVVSLPPRNTGSSSSRLVRAVLPSCVGRKRWASTALRPKCPDMALLFSLHSGKCSFSSSSSGMEDVVDIFRRLKTGGAEYAKVLDFIERSMTPKQSLVVLYREQEFIVSQIELYSRAESIVMLVELVEMNILMRVYEFLKKVRCLFSWLDDAVEQMKNLKLGLLLQRWRTIVGANRIFSGLLVQDIVLQLNQCLDTVGRVSLGRKAFLALRAAGCGRSSSPMPGAPDEDKHLQPRARCDVQVVSWRERHIRGCVCISASIDRVWEVLTEYEKLAEYIPNLVYSVKVPCPHPGRIWLLQRGMHTAMHWHIEATAILELEELPFSVNGRVLKFSMVEGDFKMFSGRWLLKPGLRPQTTILHYQANVVPKLLLPGIFVERIIKSDLPVNLYAIAKRAENLSPDGGMSKVRTGSRMLGVPIESIISSLGASEDKVASFVNSEDKSYAEKWDQRAVSPRKKRLCRTEGPCAVDAVHLRRLNEDDGECWRVAAAITIAAPCEDVWKVLTAYEDLTEFIPNLSGSRVLSRDGSRVRVLQEGCKCLLYMVLHARVVLDLNECEPTEIEFEQAEGDFEVFKGKWTLESLGKRHTSLKYTLNIKLHKDSQLLPEEIVEEVVYEDLPENLCAIRARVELGESCCIGQQLSSDSATSEEPGDLSTEDDEKRNKKTRKKVPDLQRDTEVLERELKNFICRQGKPGVMPMREELRKHGRVDLEKSIHRFGGFAAIAARWNLQLAYKDRKPKGYWEDVENLRREVLCFQQQHRPEDTSWMPTRTALEKAGRFDIARALEKWGGVHEVANILGLKARRQKGSKKHQHQQGPSRASSSCAAACAGNKSSSMSNDHEEQNAPLKTSLPIVSSVKWMNLNKEPMSRG